MAVIDLEKFKSKAKLKDRYARQSHRLQIEGRATDSIELAVSTTVANLGKTEASSLVIYGEAQSGKTEMMICLTAKLLDEGQSTIVHLMNDSVDLESGTVLAGSPVLAFFARAGSDADDAFELTRCRNESLIFSIALKATDVLNS